MLPPRFIVVEGPTGVGKTTLARALHGWFGGTLVLDPFEQNPFLPGYYGYASVDGYNPLLVEATFILLRVLQLRGVSVSDAGPLIADYSLYRTVVYAELLESVGDRRRVRDMMTSFGSELPAPDICIGLTAPTSALLRRIGIRGRPMEATIEVDHLEFLRLEYGKLLPTLVPAGGLLWQDTLDWDPRRHEDLMDVIRRIEAVSEGTHDRP